MTDAHDDSGDRRLTEWAESCAELADLLREYHQVAAPPRPCQLALVPAVRPGRIEAAWAAAYCTIVIAALVAPLVIRFAIGAISSGAAMGWDFDWPGTA